MRYSEAIVLGALLVDGTSGFAQQPDANAPSLVLLNGQIRTMDARSSVAKAVAIRGGKILAVGDSATIRSMAGPGGHHPQSPKPRRPQLAAFHA